MPTRHVVTLGFGSFNTVPYFLPTLGFGSYEPTPPPPPTPTVDTAAGGYLVLPLEEKKKKPPRRPPTVVVSGGIITLETAAAFLPLPAFAEGGSIAECVMQLAESYASDAALLLGLPEPGPEEVGPEALWIVNKILAYLGMEPLS